jgi:hypothetical protein
MYFIQTTFRSSTYRVFFSVFVFYYVFIFQFTFVSIFNRNYDISPLSLKGRLPVRGSGAKGLGPKGK